jgi:uncharacterized repeat protein (TIGR03803 family)
VFKLTRPVPPATQWTDTVLYSFCRLPSCGDGDQPVAGLVFDSSGALYGTTFHGGTTGYGTVFKLTPPAAPATQWTETVLHSFGTSQGAFSRGGVSFGSKGALYGTTEYGGTSGDGTVFKLTPPVAPATEWTETVLHSFGTSSGDGEYPYEGVIFDSKGTLYSTAYNGGTSGTGTVFKLTPPVAPATQWTETALHSFGTSRGDGDHPFAGLIFDSSGALYGTTRTGGTVDKGTVFKLTPPVAPATQWTETFLHSFGTSSSDGVYSDAGVVLSDGALYGTTEYGGVSGFGSVFKVPY